MSELTKSLEEFKEKYPKGTILEFRDGASVVINHKRKKYKGHWINYFVLRTPTGSKAYYSEIEIVKFFVRAPVN